MGASNRSAGVLEGALRRVIDNVYESGNLEELTVKRVRRAAEVELGLEEGFFKTDEGWKDRSKEFISQEVEAHENNNEPSSEVQNPKKPRKLQRKSEKKEEKKEKGPKRQQIDAERSRKRRKRKINEEDVSGIEEDISNGPKIENRRISSTLPPPPTDEIEQGDNHSDKKFQTDNVEPEESESEMSVLIDEAPKKKKTTKGRNRTSDPKERSKANKQSAVEKQKRKSASKGPADPNQEEIKHLQGWLVKCGIRKMWWKELQPFESPKAKIAHLKDMLAEAGMVGRYSQEKAAQIREERELKADLEAVQEGAKIWGKENEDASSSGARPTRQVAKGLQGLDFLNDDDGEETD